MATDFAGTNTELVDKLVGAVVELRTTIRLCLAAIGLGLPLLIGLQTFLVVQSFGTVSKVDRLSDRLDRIEQRLDRIVSRMAGLEQRMDRLEHAPKP